MRPVNLLPEGHRPRERKQGGSGLAYIVLGALGVVLIGVVFYVFTANQITSKKAETEQLREETYAAEARAGELAPFGQFQEMKAVRMASVAALAGGRFDWERVTRELAHVVPAGVWLLTLDATSTGQQSGTPSGGSGGSTSSASSGGSGGSSGAAAGAQDEGPHLKITGCAPTQSAVAETMVRLRRVQGAEEVKLVKSEQGDETTSGAAAAGGASSAATTPGSTPGATAGDQGCGTRRRRPNYEFEVTVTLSPSPDPTMGGRSVPDSLGGGA